MRKGPLLTTVSSISPTFPSSIHFFPPEREAVKRLYPVFEKRRELIKTIPKFWGVAFMNNHALAMHVQHTDDQKALTYLEDVWVIRDDDEHRAFILELVSWLPRSFALRR